MLIVGEITESICMGVDELLIKAFVIALVFWLLVVFVNREGE